MCVKGTFTFYSTAFNFTRTNTLLGLFKTKTQRQAFRIHNCNKWKWKLFSYSQLHHQPLSSPLPRGISLYCCLDLSQGLSYPVLSHRIPDLQLDLFSINVDHTGPKLHTCQWRAKEGMWFSWTSPTLRGSCSSPVWWLILCLPSVPLNPLPLFATVNFVFLEFPFSFQN